TVIGGWFMTAIIASTAAALFAVVIFYGKWVGVVLLLVLAGLLIWNAHRAHKAMEAEAEKGKVFNLESVEDPRQGIETTFEHMGALLNAIRESLDNTLEALFKQDFDRVSEERKSIKKTQKWSNIIIANVFKAMRLLDQQGLVVSHRYPQTIRRLQKLADGHRDIVLRAYTHVGNHHKGLLSVQIEELEQVRQRLHLILQEVEEVISRRQIADLARLREKDAELREFAAALNEKQMARIHNNSSKTRLSILYYGIIGNAMMISKQNLELLEIFDQSFGEIESRK
ncbi:MAG: phosphate:sodium symporter, partial [Desulfuromonas sp.]